MIGNTEPALAVYDADVHCLLCAEARFGQSLYDRNPPLDNGGEKVGLVYDHSYEPPRSGEYCGTCNKVIVEPAEFNDAEAAEAWRDGGAELLAAAQAWIDNPTKTTATALQAALNEAAKTIHLIYSERTD